MLESKKNADQRKTLLLYQFAFRNTNLRRALLERRACPHRRERKADRVAGIGGEAGDEGEASSPLHDGTVPIDMPSCRGELASPVCSTRTEAAFRSRLWGLPRLPFKIISLSASWYYNCIETNNSQIFIGIATATPQIASLGSRIWNLSLSSIAHQKACTPVLYKLTYLYLKLYGRCSIAYASTLTYTKRSC